MLNDERIAALEKRVAELEAKAQPQSLEISIPEADIAERLGGKLLSHLTSDGTDAKS